MMMAITHLNNGLLSVSGNTSCEIKQDNEKCVGNFRPSIPSKEYTTAIEA